MDKEKETDKQLGKALWAEKKCASVSNTRGLMEFLLDDTRREADQGEEREGWTRKGRQAVREDRRGVKKSVHGLTIHEDFPERFGLHKKKQTKEKRAEDGQGKGDRHADKDGLREKRKTWLEDQYTRPNR